MTDELNYFDSAYNIFHNQHINDATIENAMRDPAIEAVFANAKPGEYFQQILSIAIYRGYVIENIKRDLTT